MCQLLCTQQHICPAFLKLQSCIVTSYTASPFVKSQRSAGLLPVSALRSRCVAPQDYASCVLIHKKRDPCHAQLKIQGLSHEDIRQRKARQGMRQCISHIFKSKGCLATQQCDIMLSTSCSNQKGVQNPCYRWLAAYPWRFSRQYTAYCVGLQGE